MASTSEEESVNEDGLSTTFRACESTIEDALKDNLGVSTSASRNEKLKQCIEKLQNIAKLISRMALFSPNEQVEEFPTSSLPYLLTPAYLAYAIQELNVELERRLTYLNAAKIHYRQFLENMLTYAVISFKLPWLDSGESEEQGTSTVASTRSTEQAVRDRQKKINQHNQFKVLEEALEKLKIAQRRNDDESTQRGIYFALLRLWALRAMSELDKIEEEIKIMEYMQSMRNTGGAQTSAKPGAKNSSDSLKTFTIVKTEVQKKVFGLGYPSIPTVTVDEWFDEMSKREGFAVQPQRPKNYTVTGEGEEERISDSEEQDQDQPFAAREAKDEEERQKQITKDDWKDTHRRGWGNTYNKGMEKDKVRAVGKSWSDMIVMRDLEEKMDSASGSLASGVELNRGSESYIAPSARNPFYLDEDNCEPSEFQRKKKQLDKNQNNDPEAFGVARSRKRKLPSPEQQPGSSSSDKDMYHAEKRHSFRPDSMENNEERVSLSRPTQNKNRKRRHPKSTANVEVPKCLVSADYDVDTLFNASFPPNATVEELGELIARALGEQLPEVTMKAVSLLGMEKALVLFSETKQIEKSGGMTVHNGTRRRTPGGVFLTLFKQNKDITAEMKQDFYAYTKKVHKEREQQKLDSITKALAEYRNSQERENGATEGSTVSSQESSTVEEKEEIKPDGN
ncbi:TAP42-like family domain-containing protein [Ditylenchus destructor]|nr:TAP42-like family domain-containing protein [Ditylenchus destructor]